MLQYVSLLKSAIFCIYTDATVLAVTPRDSRMSDRDASDSKKQLGKSGAPSGADLEQENLDLKREVGFSRLHATYVCSTFNMVLYVSLWYVVADWVSPRRAEEG